ncbi:MAG: hypothetical protein Q4G60_01645, partial [bacterium]|nr:hypothetical protein [bacterium]
VETSKTTYSADDVSKLTGSVIQNKLYYDYTEKGEKHESIMTVFDTDTKFKSNTDKKYHTVTANDWGLNAEIKKAQDLKANYDNLATQAANAVTTYNTALAAVKTMSDEINKLPVRDTRLFSLSEINLSELTTAELIERLENVLSDYPEEAEKDQEEGKLLYQEQLILSLRNLLAAANNLVAIQGSLGDAEEALSATLNRLTPPSTPAGEPDPGTPTTPGGTTPTVATLTAPAVPLATIPSLTAGAAGVVAGAGVGAAGAVVDAAAGAIADAGVVIPDAEVPLAAPTVDPGNTKTRSEKLTDIDDTEVPLADDFDQSKANWLWLLLVALLGTTGAEAYRRHQSKKKAMVAETTESKEEK